MDIETDVKETEETVIDHEEGEQENDKEAHCTMKKPVKFSKAQTACLTSLQTWDGWNWQVMCH